MSNENAAKQQSQPGPNPGQPTQQNRVFIISEDTRSKIMNFLDQCPYGSVKHIVAGMNAGKFVPVEVVAPAPPDTKTSKNGQPPKAAKQDPKRVGTD